MKDNVIASITNIANDYNIKKVILFGSRARGDHVPTSDYDIGIISDNLTPLEKALIYDRIDEIETLKKIDLVFLDGTESDSFYKKIIEEGKVIYEKTKQAG
ncbi:MAG TPA: nucleotidyltransferase domain-containing protein [Thermotogota bacterium]|nr:nucleotidyltransferase domain-containing protein [Thermotogota bacterium]HRW34788.1 nucleotidyltransferase domain-containing protein [Thermotogota bacterium]